MMNASPCLRRIGTSRCQGGELDGGTQDLAFKEVGLLGVDDGQEVRGVDLVTDEGKEDAVEDEEEQLEDAEVGEARSGDRCGRRGTNSRRRCADKGALTAKASPRRSSTLIEDSRQGHCDVGPYPDLCSLI